MAGPSKLPRRARGERPFFFDDPNVDRLLSMVMGLAGEVSVLHERLDTIERLLAQKKVLPQAEIDAYQPDERVLAERAQWRETFLGEVLRIVQAELEALANDKPVPYRKVIADVTKN